MQHILLISGNASAADRQRCGGFVDFLRRRARLEDPSPGEAAADSPPREAAAEPLLRLAARGLLSYGPGPDETEILYTPSREAVRSVLAAGGETGFPEAVQKKHAAAFRGSDGALLRFPAESGEGHVEVFITDWSPCPAACAVAIHRAHPFAADLAKPDGAAFTGRYVRHPLTGDLLPVWVADWVRPDFGTGAVLVNPAHDATDLAFGRAVGLPIRFALAPAGYDGSPATWPQPPVVKSGRTIRTGPYDGLEPGEAAARYFEVMAERGLAERYRDLQAGRWKIGRLVPDATAERALAWHPARHTVLPGAAPEAGALAVRFEAADLFAAALAGTEGPRPILVAPAGEQAGDLLALRLLAADLAGGPLEPAALFLVQKVQETKVEAPAEVGSLAALLGAPVQQVAVIKQQAIEQIQKFLRVHRELLDQAVPPGQPADGAALRPLSKVKAAVREADPAKAFSLLLQTQKQLRELSAEARTGALAGYFILAEAVAGLAPPAGLDAGKIWDDIP